MFSWLNTLNKQSDLKGQRNMCLCGGPCHLSSFKQCSGDLIFLWEQLVYSLLETINMYLYEIWVWFSSPKLHSAPLNTYLHNTSVLPDVSEQKHFPRLLEGGLVWNINVYFKVQSCREVKCKNLNCWGFDCRSSCHRNIILLRTARCICLRLALCPLHYFLALTPIPKLCRHFGSWPHNCNASWLNRPRTDRHISTKNSKLLLFCTSTQQINTNKTILTFTICNQRVTVQLQVLCRGWTLF